MTLLGGCIARVGCRIASAGHGAIVKTNARRMTNVQTSHRSTPEASEHSLLTTQLPSGARVVSCDRGEPLSQVSLVFHAGTRFESPNYRGVVHRIQNCVGSNTNRLSSIKFNYDLAALGAHVKSEFSRELLRFDLTCVRDKLTDALPYLAEMVYNVSYEDWYFGETSERMEIERELAYENPAATLMEMLHAVAYPRSRMGHALLSPKWMIERHTPAMVKRFVEQNLVSNACVVVGSGVEHEKLVSYVSKQLPVRKSERLLPIAANYVGGERTEEYKDSYVFASIGNEGFSCKDVHSVAAQLVFSSILGSTGAYGYHSVPTPRFQRAVAASALDPVHSCCFNYFYSDTGLFGMYVRTTPEDLASILKTAVGELRRVAQGHVSEHDIKGAKEAAKRTLIMERGLPHYVSNDVAVQMLLGNGRTIDMEEFCNMIDHVSSNDLHEVGRKLTKVEKINRILKEVRFAMIEMMWDVQFRVLLRTCKQSRQLYGISFDDLLFSRSSCDSQII
uniref:Peptidase_M16_C domain-containing protein n=2 Tax=Trichuris muris TaxID=70415 RepID=A0A5S6Q0E6_TRIMR